MKLTTFAGPDGRRQVGIHRGDSIQVVEAADMVELIRETRGEPDAILKRVVAEVEAREVRVLAPIKPTKLVHTAGNFKEHDEESKRVGWSHAVGPWIVFMQNVDAIIGPDDGIRYPDHLTRELDYELELCVVMNQDVGEFSAEDAMKYVAGYVIFNDVTARDIQREEMKSGVFGFCKGIDSFCPLGPWIVTADEIPDPHDLDMRLRVNGDVRQESHSSNMWTTIPEILARYSPLGYSAGDVVTTGTVSGVAGFREDAEDYYLQVGDIVECEIERIGTLRNEVVPWSSSLEVPRW
jgi:2-keto-4-pentenoate hydratase/2-oxohepta-3-ene-1,7-dioic acid hydratase in catechol pathway